MHNVAREGEGRQRDNRAYVEFGINLQSNIVVVTRRRDNIGTGPKGLPGLRRCSTRSSNPITPRLKRAHMDAIAAKRF